MFIIDGTGDPATSLPRLVRLMLNIERGEKAYEWCDGSDSAPLPQAEPNFLSVRIPAVTAGAPTTTLVWKPSVGFIFYQTTPAWVKSNLRLTTVNEVTTADDVFKFACKLSDICDKYPKNHLSSSLPVDMNSYGALHHKGRTTAGSKVYKITPSELKDEKHALDNRIPIREFAVLTGGYSINPPHHAGTSGFTWFICPVSSIIHIKEFTKTSEINAVLSSIFFDTVVGGRESPNPFEIISTQTLFGIRPPAPRFAVEKIQKSNWYKMNSYNFPIFIYYNSQLHVAGAELLRHLGAWKNPDTNRTDEPSLPAGAKIANLECAGIDHVCGLCVTPLWGDVYVSSHQLIAPYFMAICRWCCGCLTRVDQAKFIKINSGLTRATVFQKGPLWDGEFYKKVFPVRILTAPAKLVTAKEGAFIIIDTGVDKKLILEDPSTFSEIPPCFRVSKLKDVKHPSVYYHRLASLGS